MKIHASTLAVSLTLSLAMSVTLLGCDKKEGGDAPAGATAEGAAKPGAEAKAAGAEGS